MNMETPTCVIDATTLVDHIHQIKTLIYDGHIRLAVPMSTVDRVDQIYRKSIEAKPEPEKAARPKSGGKPVKVYPTFDISPRVAREFLERSRQEESKLSVDFQKEEEQYTTWKNLEIQEEQEKQKNAEGKPATFAAALLAKLNITEAPAQIPKGPVKPKLVARGPGATNSPWKRAVPTIAADGVSSTLRPVLGYVLWRLHERETYSFVKDSSILVSDDKETGVTAQKLGIAVETFHAFSSKVKAQHKPETDVSTWGELEREFGNRGKSAAPSRNGVHQSNEHALSMPENKEPKLEDLSVTEDDKQNEVMVEVVHKDEKLDKPNIEEEQPEEKLLELAQDGIVAPEMSQPEEAATKENAPVTPRAWADVVSNRTRPVQGKLTPLAPKSQNVSLPTDVSLDKSKDSLMDEAAQEKASTIADWVQKVKAAGSEGEPQRSPPSPHKKPKTRKAKEPTPPPEEPPKPFRPILMQRTPNSSQIASDRAPSPIRTPSIEHRKNGEIINHTPSASMSSAHSLAAKAESSNTPPSAKAPSSQGQPAVAPSVKAPSAKAPSPEDPVIDEPEDSDDEVVVFNPRAKRISAQQAPKQAALEKPFALQEQEPKPAQLPAEDPVADQQQGLKQTSPDRAGPPKNRRQAKPRAPVVIDPDAFGRDFASNPRPHQQVAHPRTRPRPISQHGLPPNGLPTQRPISQHGPPRPDPRGGRYQHGHFPLNKQAAPNGQNGYVSNMQNGQKMTNSYSTNAENGNTTNGSNGPSRLVPHGSPPQEPQSDKAGPDIDFVLKSGSTRGATRGRGKLWIP